MTYYNTTTEAPDQVTMFSKKNVTQDEQVLSIALKLGVFSAKDIYKRFPVANVPITSIRRSINTLYKEGKITQTGYKVKGLYGRNEYQYRII